MNQGLWSFFVAGSNFPHFSLSSPLSLPFSPPSVLLSSPLFLSPFLPIPGVWGRASSWWGPGCYPIKCFESLDAIRCVWWILGTIFLFLFAIVLYTKWLEYYDHLQIFESYGAIEWILETFCSVLVSWCATQDLLKNLLMLECNLYSNADKTVVIFAVRHCKALSCVNIKD